MQIISTEWRPPMALGSKIWMQIWKNLHLSLEPETSLSCVHLSLIIEHYIIPFRAFVPSTPNRLIVNCFDLINIGRTSGRVATRGYSCFQCLSTLFPRHNTESV